jgi:hypothetical protein
MEARWNDPRSDPGVAKAKREEHDLRVDTAGLLMEGAEADTKKLGHYDLWYRSGGGRGCSSVDGQRFLVQLSA